MMDDLKEGIQEATQGKLSPKKLYLQGQTMSLAYEKGKPIYYYLRFLLHAIPTHNCWPNHHSRGTAGMLYAWVTNYSG